MDIQISTLIEFCQLFFNEIPPQAIQLLNENETKSKENKSVIYEKKIEKELNEKDFKIM